MCLFQRMSLLAVYSALLTASLTVLVVGQQTVLEQAASIEECVDNINVYSCLSSTYSKDLIQISLECGSDFNLFANNFAAQCIRNGDGEFCFGVLSELNLTEAAACSEAINSSCATPCKMFLEDIVHTVGCCFNTVFNERLSQIIFGYNIQTALVECEVEALPPCDSQFDLSAPTNAESCTFSEYWGRVVEYLCSAEVAQPYVDDILKNEDCTPIARHYSHNCGQGPNDRFCLDILQGSYPLVNPTQTAFVNPFLSEAISKCANYTKFSTDTCPESCKSALQSALDEFGCCINIMFNDTVNEVTLPYFSGDVMNACGLASPGECVNDIVFVRGSTTAVKTVAYTWMYQIYLAVLLYCLI